MGFGDDHFGDALFGQPVADGVVAVASTPPRALKINAATRGFDLDTNGRYIDIHPIDAAVATALLAVKGKIPSAPTTGAAYQQNDDPFGDRAPKTAEYIVRSALQRLITRGDVKLDLVLFEPTSSGGNYEVHYINNRLLPNEVQKVSASA